MPQTAFLATESGRRSCILRPSTFYIHIYMYLYIYICFNCFVAILASGTLGVTCPRGDHKGPHSYHFKCPSASSSSSSPSFFSLFFLFPLLCPIAVVMCLLYAAAHDLWHVAPTLIHHRDHYIWHFSSPVSNKFRSGVLELGASDQRGSL